MNVNVDSGEAASQSGTAASVRIPGKPGWMDKFGPSVLGGGTIFLFLAIWQSIAWARVVPELFLPGPLSIANALVQLFQTRSIWYDLWVSFQEVIYGFGLAILVGLPLGMLMGW